MKLKRLFLIVLLLFGVLATYTYRKEKGALVIGAKSNPESHLISEMFAQYIEKELKIPVVRRFHLEGTRITFNALKSGNIDLYVEYTGSALLDILHERPKGKEIYPYLKEIFEKRYGLHWMPRLGFSNQYAVVVRESAPWTAVSEFLSHPQSKVGVDPEFRGRLEAKTLLEQARPVILDQTLLHFCLLEGKIDAFIGFTNDGRLNDPAYKLLEDDIDLFPTYEAAFLVNKKIFTHFPDLEPLLRNLENRITDEQIRAHNTLIEKEKQPVKEVARNLLKSLL